MRTMRLPVIAAPAYRLWRSAGPSGARLALRPPRIFPSARAQGVEAWAWGNRSSSMARRTVAVTAASSSSVRLIVGGRI